MTQTIEQRARELLARQIEIGLWHDQAESVRAGFTAGDVPLISAVAALTEALTRIEELEGAIQTHFEALDRHDKSNDGFGKSRETYAEVMGTLHVLRQAKGVAKPTKP